MNPLLLERPFIFILTNSLFPVEVISLGGLWPPQYIPISEDFGPYPSRISMYSFSQFLLDLKSNFLTLKTITSPGFVEILHSHVFNDGWLEIVPDCCCKVPPHSKKYR